LTFQCQRKGEVAAPMPSPSEGNSINYEGVAYPLTHAIERRFNPIPSPGDSHLGAEFKFADSEFFLIPLPVGPGGVINIWEPSGETVYLRADIYHPGTEPFSSAEFRHFPDSVDDGDQEVAGVAFFNEYIREFTIRRTTYLCGAPSRQAYRIAHKKNTPR